MIGRTCSAGQDKAQCLLCEARPCWLQSEKLPIILCNTWQHNLTTYSEHCEGLSRVSKRWKFQHKYCQAHDPWPKNWQYKISGATHHQTTQTSRQVKIGVTKDFLLVVFIQEENYNFRIKAKYSNLTFVQHNKKYFAPPIDVPQCTVLTMTCMIKVWIHFRNVYGYRSFEWFQHKITLLSDTFSGDIYLNKNTLHCQFFTKNLFPFSKTFQLDKIKKKLWCPRLMALALTFDLDSYWLSVKLKRV